MRLGDPPGDRQAEAGTLRVPKPHEPLEHPALVRERNAVGSSSGHYHRQRGASATDWLCAALSRRWRAVQIIQHARPDVRFSLEMIVREPSNAERTALEYELVDRCIRYAAAELGLQ